MKGTPFIYQGEELGMTNVRFESIEQYKDIETLNAYREYVIENGMDSSEFLKAVHARGRDNARTPFHWDDSKHAGFTTGTPWIEVNPNYPKINAKEQMGNPDSVFYYYKKLIELRKQHDIIVYGKYDLLLEDDEQIFAFTRTLDDEKLLVICNFSSGQPEFALPKELDETKKRLLISNYPVEENESIREFTLKPYETRVYHL
jgi:oligo-1,6-glucosidase